jgi:hypothetical protein
MTRHEWILREMRVTLAAIASGVSVHDALGAALDKDGIA